MDTGGMTWRACLGRGPRVYGPGGQVADEQPQYHLLLIHAFCSSVSCLGVNVTLQEGTGRPAGLPRRPGPMQ